MSWQRKQNKRTFKQDLQRLTRRLDELVQTDAAQSKSGPPAKRVNRPGDTIDLKPLRSLQSSSPKPDGVLKPTQPGQPVNARVRRWQAVLRSLAYLFIFLLFIGGLALAGGIITYVWIAAQLPSAEELPSRSLKFETTQILDREGNLLWEIIDPTGGRRTNVSLDHISPELIQATLATEDRFFYLNVGVDPIAIARATYSNLSEQQIVSGGSTITQQLARNVFLEPEERTQKTFSRKLREAILAIEINRRYTKDQILETYFNQIYYGNLAYGIEAAAQTYFGKPAKDLNLSEAAMLAGLPQSPALHDPYLYPDRAKARQRDVLALMVEAGYITTPQAKAAAAVELNFRELRFPLEAPHFVSLARQELEQSIPPAYIYRVGLRIYTTLDPRLQAIAEEALRRQVEALAERNVTNGALVAIDVRSGHILAFVGSRDFQNKAIDGQVNMVTSPRQPGSTMKPLTYLATFERLGWTPSTLLMDTPVVYSDSEGNVYRPTNVDGKFHGPVSVRAALANSYNIPAVKALEKVGVEALKETAARLGITTLTEDYYGLSLTLGSGEVSLLEMTGAYQTIANGGVLVKPTTVEKITDSFGREIEPPHPPRRQVMHEAHAYLLTHILADNEARRPSFGLDSPLHLSRPAAVKTGTTNDFRDNWVIGYTPDIVAGVWVGNADNKPMAEVGGATGAAPIWHDFMEQAHADLPIHDFARPPTIIELEVCADSGTLPGDLCPRRRTEIFFEKQPPFGPERDIHQLIEIDLKTGLLANEFCRANLERRYYRVFPPDGRSWAIRHGIAQPPARACPSSDIIAHITSPQDSISIRGTIPLTGSAVARDFAFYQLELGKGTNPQEFSTIQGSTERLRDNDLLGTFDTTQLENGPYTLRLVVFDKTGGYATAQVRVLVDNPPGAISLQTPVTTPLPTFTPTLTPTLTLTVTGVTGTPAPALSTPGVLTAPLNISPQPAEATPAAADEIFHGE